MLCSRSCTTPQIYEKVFINGQHSQGYCTGIYFLVGNNGFMKKSITFALCFQSFYRKLVGITVHYIAGNLIGSLFFLAIVVLWNPFRIPTLLGFENRSLFEIWPFFSEICRSHLCCYPQLCNLIASVHWKACSPFFSLSMGVRNFRIHNIFHWL